MATMLERMIGAAKLDPATYEEVEGDPSATGQAMVVVVLSAVAAGIGGISLGAKGFVVALISALVGWFVWAGLTFVIGTKLLPESGTQADFGQLLRTIGFSASPGVLQVAGVVPVLGAVVAFFASLWMLAAMVVAVRQALDYKSLGRAIVVCLLGWLVNIAITVVLVLMFGLASGMAGGFGGTPAVP
jgi:hypothetical protein